MRSHHAGRRTLPSSHQTDLLPTLSVRALDNLANSKSRRSDELGIAPLPPPRSVRLDIQEVLEVEVLVLQRNLDSRNHITHDELGVPRAANARHAEDGLEAVLQANELMRLVDE